MNPKEETSNIVRQETAHKNNDWKERLNVVYSTNPDYSYEMEDDGEQVTLPLSTKPACSIGSQESRRKSSHTCHGFRRYGK